MGLADGLHARFGKPPVLDVSYLNQLANGPGHVFDWHVRIDAMLNL